MKARHSASVAERLRRGSARGSRRTSREGRPLASRLKRRAIAAYTVVEVMMALSILSIGATGVVAMQKAALIGNTRARDLATATAIASSWVERLRYDALRWTYDGTNNTLASTNYLNLTQDIWFRPTGIVAPGPLTEVASMTDVKGMDTTLQAESAFCVNIRLSTVMSTPGVPNPVPAAIRADVRVFWLRVHHTTVDAARSGTLSGLPFCDPTATTITNLGTADGSARYHFVYATTAIMRNDI